MTDLRNEELSKLGVLNHSMRQIGGDEIDVPLDLMHHGICVGHLGPVTHAGDPVPAHHSVNFLVNSTCMTQQCLSLMSHADDILKCHPKLGYRGVETQSYKLAKQSIPFCRSCCLKLL